MTTATVTVLYHITVTFDMICRGKSLLTIILYHWLSYRVECILLVVLPRPPPLTLGRPYGLLKSKSSRNNHLQSEMRGLLRSLHCSHFVPCWRLRDPMGGTPRLPDRHAPCGDDIISLITDKLLCTY